MGNLRFRLMVRAWIRTIFGFGHADSALELPFGHCHRSQAQKDGMLLVKTAWDAAPESPLLFWLLLAPIAVDVATANVAISLVCTYDSRRQFCEYCC